MIIVRQCTWVWDLHRHAWLQMASVVFLSNITIHCSSLSSLTPPTTGYFSEDKHFQKHPSETIYNSLLRTVKTHGEGETDTIHFTHYGGTLVTLQDKALLSFSKTKDTIVLSHKAERICNNLLILGCGLMWNCRLLKIKSVRRSKFQLIYSILQLYYCLLSCLLQYVVAIID